MKLVAQPALNPLPTTFADIKPAEVFWSKSSGLCMKVRNTHVAACDTLHLFGVNLSDGRVCLFEQVAPVKRLVTELHHEYVDQ